jgi:DNA-binding XRE family transcriptional regulator
MSNNVAFDVAHARDVLLRGRALWSNASPARKRGSSTVVPPIIACTFDTASDAFHVVYQDWRSQDLARTRLSDVADRQVVAWGVDSYGRGVEVALDDGSMTSFSAEFPFYANDAGYRKRVDERHGSPGPDLGRRIAQRLRAARRQRGCTVADLARRTGIAAPNIHRVESGRHVPSTYTIARLAEALGIPIEHVFGAE